MNRDVHPSRQPKGTYRYALNTTVETREGNLLSLSNDRGTQEIGVLSKKVIGTCYLGEDRILVFSTDNESSEIGILDGDYQVISSLDCLNFSTSYPIDSIFRVREGCKDTIYFTDGLNPVRVIDLSKSYDSCEDLQLFRGFSLPSIEKTVTSNGQLAQGSYQIAVQYLDSNYNGTNWFLDTAPINIFDGTTYDSIKGNDQVTNKSIQLKFSSLDTAFPYYRVAINEYTSGEGVLSRTLLSPRIPISQSIVRINGRYEGYEESTIEDIQIDQIAIESAFHIEQIENRLILANVKEKQIEWCGFQEYANRIRVGYTTEAVPKYVPSLGNSMFPDKQTSFMGNEVYALSVAYLFEDGYRSPFFNIPGRLPTLNDLQPLTVVDSLLPTIDQIHIDNVVHLGLEVGDTIERYKVQNTGRNGTLGYHQLSTVYPDTETCDGDKVWGELAGQPVRHHLMPDRSNEPLYDEDYTYPLYFTVDNVEFPREDIIGYVIAIANAETVQDKGFVFPVWVISDTGEFNQDFFFGEAEFDEPRALIDEEDLLGRVIFTPPPSAEDFDFIRSEEKIVIVTPKHMFLKETVGGDFIQIESNLRRTGGREDSGFPGSVQGDPGDDAEIKFNFVYYDYGAEAIPTYKLRGIEESRRFTIGQTVNIGTTAIRNKSKTNEFMQYDLSANLDTDIQGLYYVSIKSAVESLTDLDSINYRLAVDNVLTDSAIIRGGDTFICPLTYENFVDEAIRRTLTNNIRKYDLYGSLLTNIFIESKVNTFLRDEGTDFCQSFFRPTSDYVPAQPRPDNVGAQYLFGKYTTGTASEYAGLCEQYTGYNEDFGLTGRIISYNTLASDFDCCTACLGEFSSRIIYSSQSFQEEKQDHYRIFLPNNYKDIESEKGKITNLFRYQNNLYIQTTDALWYLPQNIQERASQEGIVSYIGTGDFFAIPPRLILDTVKGGCVDKFSVVKVPDGVFYFDSTNGDPYIFNGQLNGLDEGMRSWFEEQRNTLRDLVGDALPNSPYFGGAFAVYDTRHERIFLTWKDYEPKNWVGVRANMLGRHIQDHVYFDSTAKRFFVNGEYVDVESEWFCNKSWTVSYSFLSKDWVSFHSFAPDWITYGKTSVYSFANGKIWKHGSGQHNNYYGVDYPHIFEYVETSPVTKIWDSVKIYSDGIFNQLLVYNSYQGTGLLDLNQPGTTSGYMMLRVKEPVSIVRQDQNYYVNGFYDTGLDISFECVDFTRSDKIFNSVASRQWFNRPPMEDKYILIRLIQTDNKAITTNFIVTTNGESEK